MVESVTVIKKTHSGQFVCYDIMIGKNEILTLWFVSYEFLFVVVGL